MAHGVPECTQCVSLPILLARLVGGGLPTAAWVGLGLAAIWGVWQTRRFRSTAWTPRALVSMAILVTLLAGPYLLNYDYLLLLVPLMVFAGTKLNRLEWIGLGLAYVLPPVALVVAGSAGHLSLIASAGILAGMSLRGWRREWIQGQGGRA
jgi:hypothetical protein